jgi:two-component system, NarL family, nitrate/nitrite response regulator NarL
VTTVVIGDDHAVFLDALSSVLTGRGWTVTQAATVEDTILAVRAEQPDLCLVDRHFRAGADSIGAIGQLRQACARTKILMLSADGDSDSILRAMRSGAAGFVHKTRGVAVLQRTIDRVLQGEVVVEAPASGGTPGAGVRPHLARQQDAMRLAAFLTAREWQSLELLVEGQDTVAMARTMGVSAATIRTHVQSLLSKLGVHSRLEAAAFAVQHGLLDEALRSGGLTDRRAS